MNGRLIGIARRDARRAPMQTIDEVAITLERGVEGDHKGAKFKRRAVTILAREDWEAALAALAGVGRGMQRADTSAIGLEHHHGSPLLGAPRPRSARIASWAALMAASRRLAAQRSSGGTPPAASLSG